MGVTDLRPYFTQIIGNNSVHVYWIPTKLGTEIRLNEPFKCAKFQPDGNTHSCFLAARIWKWLERFSSNLQFGLPYLAGTTVANLVSIG